MSKVKLDNRLWAVLTILISGALIAAGWFVGVDPRLQAAAAADLQRTTIETDTDATRTQIAGLATEKERIGELDNELVALQAAVPPGVMGTAFIRQLNDVAAASGATIVSFTLETPEKYTAVVPAPADPNAPTVADIPAPAADASVTGDNFVVVPIQLSLEGTNEQVLNFLGGLQRGQRLVLVTTVSRQIAGEDVDLHTMEIGGYAFVLRNAAAEAEAAAADAETTEG